MKWYATEIFKSMLLYTPWSRIVDLVSPPVRHWQYWDTYFGKWISEWLLYQTKYTWIHEYEGHISFSSLSGWTLFQTSFFLQHLCRILCDRGEHTVREEYWSSSQKKKKKSDIGMLCNSSHYWCLERESKTFYKFLLCSLQNIFI